MEEREERRHLGEEEIDLYDLWLKLVRRKKLILGFFTAGVLIALAAGLVMTPVYRSSASLLPVSSGSGTALARLADVLPGFQPGTGDTSSKVLAVLESRSIRERVVKRVGYERILGGDPPRDRDPVNVAAEALENMITVSRDRDTGLVRISVEHRDPELAQTIGKVLIEELKSLLGEKTLTIAKANRLFLENQLRETEEELRMKLRELARFQREEKMIAPQEQIKGSLELYTELLSRKVSLQIELRKLESVLSPDSSRIEYLRRQIEAIDSQLSKIETAESGLSAVPSLEATPEKMASYTEIFLKVRGLQSKYETLLKLYEQAKMEERKEFIYVEVIDPPSLPEIPEKPKVKLMVAVAGVTSLFLGVFAALFLEWLSTLRERRREVP